MRLQGNAYTFAFALAVCVVCSLSLSAVSEGLRERKEDNVKLDIQKNILKAVNLREPIIKGSTPQDILGIYQEKIEVVVIDAQGQLVDGKSLEDIKEGEALYPLYIYKEGGDVIAYCFPIKGQGLWSTLYGYFALEPDAITVRGITFYKHGETPGLGAEIEQDWFQDNFKGKKVWDFKDNALVPTAVVKGKVVDKVSDAEAQFYVDGISGATITSKGVTAMIDKWLNVYEPYFEKVRNLSR